MSSRSDRRVRRVWSFARMTVGELVTANGSLGENPSGAQCVNICNLWWAHNGASQLYGNASDWVGVRTASLEWLPMRHSRRLRAGDVAVFHPSSSAPDGHVDVVLDGSRIPYLGLDQNWPLGAAVSFVEHDRELLAGLIRYR